MSEEKVKNCSIPEYVSEEVTKINDMKLVKSIHREAEVDENPDVNVVRRPARFLGMNIEGR